MLSAGAVTAAALLAEAGARVWLHGFADQPAFERHASIAQLRARYGEFSRFQAHRHLGFALVPGYQKGDNRHNQLGFRGEEITVAKPPGVRRIVCCGGSTTYGEGTSHDYRLSVPFLVQQGLRTAGQAFEVVNAGCPGWTTLETLINFETRLLELQPDFAVVYHGINDVLPRLVWPPEAYRADWSGWLVRDEHVVEASLLERSTLARILLVNGGVIEPHGSLLRIIGDVPPTSRTFAFRTQRLQGTYPSGVFGEVPIERMLDANPPVFFERNLRSLLAIAAANGVRVLLCTFAYSKEFPHRDYIGHPAVQAAIDGTNEIVRRLGRETDTPVLDLAPELTAKELFTDGVHFTALGNRRRAALLLQAFAELLR
ncbi:MAG: SGNH/GDSL hydrolase family protein [Planctomycetes bacterium]|nr:SGNH/GDSL hydrolase family protein [Planctomycetota bacterium]